MIASLGFVVGLLVGLAVGAIVMTFAVAAVSAGALEDDRRARASFTPHPTRRIHYDDDDG